MTEQSYPQLRFVDRRHWRQWLADNGDSSGVWVLTAKLGPRRRLSYGEIVEEALCFGWASSLRRSTGEAGTSRFLMIPRRPGSVWSATEKERVDVLIERGSMDSRGLSVVEGARQDGSWSALDEVMDLL
ncbi:uncharacterized protein YdeI (YjbR/CyaY-like superfamily) [Nakamurella sp. UYEF19]|uniref:YdeI/OmpD-associated family protein n=1 Tax=Nakamurella sp. UYEF19 TaxID=1756392 RepID=UPI00339B03B5